MTENKRFTFKDGYLFDDVKGTAFLTVGDCCELLNELHDEKEKWKSFCLNSSSENSILWNEIDLMQEQGAEPSDAFKEYRYKLKKELFE